MRRPVRDALIVVGSTVLVLTGCAETNGPKPGEPTSQAISMKAALADVARVRAYIYGGGSQADAAAAAIQLDAFGKGLPALFPPKSAPNEYVDMSAERASAAPQAVTASAQALSAAIATGERVRVAQALDSLERNGCGACHRPAAAPNT
jgi:hypothetical protein